MGDVRMQLEQRTLVELAASNAMDSYGGELTFTYDSTQHSVRWCVTEIERDDSVSVTFSYNTTRLTGVTYADGAQASNSVSYSFAFDADVITVTDPYARHLEGKYYTTTGYVGDDTASPPLISLFVPGEIIRVLNKDDQPDWEQYSPEDDALDEKLAIHQGKMRVRFGDGTKQDVLAWENLGAAAPQWKQYRNMANGSSRSPARLVSTRANYVSTTEIPVARFL
jgi:hypothetical protein